MPNGTHITDQTAPALKPGRGRREKNETGAAPAVSPFWFSGFTWYVTRFVAKNFHAVRLLKGSNLPAQDSAPWIICLNHPSWWDPMIGVVLANRLMPQRRHYAVIEAQMLAKYPVFEKVGFVGVTPGSARGAAEFLRAGQAALSAQASTLWVTGEGRFSDVRARPVVLRQGVAALAKRVPGALIIPVALDYVYWTERYPEALCAIGQPIRVEQFAHGIDPTDKVSRALEQTMDELASSAMTRDPSRFETLLGGSVGVGGFYDLWRAARAVYAGQRFDPGHGQAAHEANDGSRRIQ
jgi:1-acyl-sn-glycerol-3-phosphate acyltransferase